MKMTYLILLLMLIGCVEQAEVAIEEELPVNDNAQTPMPPVIEPPPVDDEIIGEEVEGEVVGSKYSPLAIGTVAETAELCEAGNLSNTECKVVRVSCPDLNGLKVKLKITQPSTNHKGTIILGSGGNGGGFVDANSFMKNLVTKLADDGYLVVQRAWVSTWTASNSGMAKAACRYATLVNYIEENYNSESKPLCAGGNSAGGSEISYALARFEQDKNLDFALVTGGPPMGRLDLGCYGGEQWDNGCDQEVPEGAYEFSRSLGCKIASANFSLINAAYGKSKACSDKVAEYRDLMYQDSLGTEHSKINYPNTLVSFVYGGEDFSFATPSGHTYSNLISSQKMVNYLPGVGHGIISTLDGADEYYRQFSENCK